MTAIALQRLLLGPQNPKPILPTALETMKLPEGPIAVITAGWQEAEGDIGVLQKVFDQPLIDLRLYQRAEEVSAADPDLWKTYRDRQEQLKDLQSLYRMRLRQLKTAARNLMRSSASPALLDDELAHAISQVRELDQHHQQRVEAIHQQFDQYLEEVKSDLVGAHVDAVMHTLEACQSVVIAGGNILVLLNRLRLFGLHRPLAERHLIAWSAGAMVLGDLIVLYHDHTAHGRRDPEVLGKGLGVLPGHIFFPDASRRLRIKEKNRLNLLSQRFAPANCVTLDNGAFVRFSNQKIDHSRAVRYIARGGRLRRLRA